MTELLDQLVPVRRERRPDWNDVLRRAEVGVSQPRDATATPAPRRRRLMLAIALVVLVVAGTAIGGLGRGAFDGLSSWLRGDPGTSAPASEQAGFAARNASSYAAFPEETKLRLLQRQRAGGKTFSLLGFRSGSSLCLRLIRSDRPSARGGNECVTLRELRSSAAPALVAAEASFQVGDPAMTVQGIFGFADDTVRAIELRQLGGSHRTAKVSSNVFLALQAGRSGTVADHPPFDPVVRVRAVTDSAAPVVVPFIARDMGDYGGRVPTGPSYLKRPGLIRPGAVPGPTRVEAPFRNGTAGWIERRETRGEPWNPDRVGDIFGTVLFSRAVQPDPDDPFRIGVWLVRVDRHSRVGRVGRTGVMLCASDLHPLMRGEGGASCIPPGKGRTRFPAGQPLVMSWMGPSQISRVTGLAADQVARIEVHLASGRVVPAALRDNTFTVSVPTAQMPAKLVVRDHRDRVIWINVLHGSAIPTPCPPAAPGDRLRSSAPRPYERIDLATRTVNGSKVFGRSPAEIRAALGRPDRVIHPKAPKYFYGGERDDNASLIVQFGRRHGRQRAISFTYRGRTLVDARLGNLLAMQPAELERRIQRVHGSTFRSDYAYGSIPGRGCIGGFVSRFGRAELTFGVYTYRPSGRPFVILSHGY